MNSTVPLKSIGIPPPSISLSLSFSFVSPYTDLHGTHASITIGILDVDDKLGRIRNEQQEAA